MLLILIYIPLCFMHFWQKILIFFFIFSGSPLGYNLAVNTALHAGGLSAGRPGMQPSPRGPGLTGQAGNCQPGYPPRPSEVTNIRYVFSLNISLKLRLWGLLGEDSCQAPERSCQNLNFCFPIKTERFYWLRTMRLCWEASAVSFNFFFIFLSSS